MMLNRLQAHWGDMKPKILKKWGRLGETELDGIEGQFDRLVELIRNRYKPGRSLISVEANIYDWLLAELHQLERENLHD